MGLFKLTKTCAPALFIIILTVFSCSTQKVVSSDSPQKTEANVTGMITTLPEVKKADALCKKKSHGKTHLVTYIVDRPTPTESFYSLKVAEDNGTVLHTRYTFIVYPKTNKIYFVDVLHAKYIALAVWRKQKGMML
jgi:hypothetical protein